MEAFNILTEAPNTQVVAFDSDGNFETVAHKVISKDYTLYDVTVLTEEDIQGIFSGIPKDIKNTNYTKPFIHGGVYPSLFEVIEANTNRKLPELHTRFCSLLQRLDVPLHDLLVMIAYVHDCRTPVSYDMALAFLRDYAESYEAVIDMIRQLGKLVAEELADAEQDYFSPRSTIIAKAILKEVTNLAFRRVFLKFHKELSPYRIYNYDTFKRKAFDAGHVGKAFPNLNDWEAEKNSMRMLIKETLRHIYFSKEHCFYLIEDGIERPLIG